MVTEDKVRELAYQLWEEKGKPEGSDVENYFDALRKLETGEPSAVATPAVKRTRSTAAAKKSSAKGDTAVGEAETPKRARRSKKDAP
jgi:hypothetical protein